MTVVYCSTNVITYASVSSAIYYLESGLKSLGIPSWSSSLASCGNIVYSLTVNGTDYSTYSTMFPTSDAFNTETGEINLESRDTSKVSGHSFVLKATVRDIYVESSFTVSYLRECVETSIIPPNQVT